MNKTMSRIADATTAARHWEGGRFERHMGHYSVKCTGSQAADVSYRGTVVANFDGCGHVVLNTGGWQTATTKNVINAALRDTPFSVHQVKGEWFVDSELRPGGSEACSGHDAFHEGILLAPISIRPTFYNVVRMFQDDRPNKTIKRDLTLGEAQAHCRRDDTHGTGWFDGYEEA